MQPENWPCSSCLILILVFSLNGYLKSSSNCDIYDWLLRNYTSLLYFWFDSTDSQNWNFKVFLPCFIASFWSNYILYFFCYHVFVEDGSLGFPTKLNFTIVPCLFWRVLLLYIRWDQVESPFMVCKWKLYYARNRGPESHFGCLFRLHFELYFSSTCW